MEKQEKDMLAENSIDLTHFARALLRKLWLIVLVGIIFGGIGYARAAFSEVPHYSSSILLYINNTGFDSVNSSGAVSGGDLSTSRSLVNSYKVVLTSRTTLERVIEQAGLPYSPAALRSMISIASQNETETLTVTVTATDPYEAAKIANCIAEVLPERVAEVIRGSSVSVVDNAVPNMGSAGSGVARAAVKWLLIGVALAVAFVLLQAYLDNTIHSEEYVLNTYGYPLLAKIPNLLAAEPKGYGRYDGQGYGPGENRK